MACDIKSAIVKKLELKDIPRISDVHRGAFPDSVLTKMGDEFIRRYYAWQFNGPHDLVALGAFMDYKLVGFCFGGIFRGAMSGFLRKERNFIIRYVLCHPLLALKLITVPKLFLSVRIIFRSFIGSGLDVFYPKKVNPTQKFGILSLAVCPSFQKKGIGKLLMAEIESKAKSRRYSDMVLTVNGDNKIATNFYYGIGWEKSIQRKDGNIQMVKHIV